MNAKEYTEYDRQKLGKELFLVLYLWGFAILRPLLLSAGRYSTVILASYALLLCIGYTLKAHIRQISIRQLAVLGYILFALLIDYSLRSNQYTGEYLYYYIIYAIVTTFLMLGGINATIFLKYYSVISLVVALIFIWAPFAGWDYITSYMDLGYTYLLPAYIGISVYKLSSRNWKFLSILQLVIFVEIAVYANRGALFAIIFFNAVMFFFGEKRRQKRIIWFLCFIVLSIVIVLNLGSLVKLFYDFLISRGIESYSMSQFYSSFVLNSGNDFTSGRFWIWSNVLNLANESLLLGNGVGAFEVRYNETVHNILLEIFVHYGIIGLLVFSIIFIFAFLSLRNATKLEKLLALAFFCQAFPKLLFSTTMYKDFWVWAFLSFCFSSIGKDQKVVKAVLSNG